MGKAAKRPVSLGLYPPNLTASNLTSLTELLRAYMDFDFIVNLALMYNAEPPVPVTLPPIDDAICIYILLRYIDPAVALVQKLLQMQPTSEKPAYFVHYCIFSVLVMLAKGARALRDARKAAQDQDALQAAKEQEEPKLVATGLSLDDSLTEASGEQDAPEQEAPGLAIPPSPMVSESLCARSAHMWHEYARFSMEGNQKSEFCLTKRLEKRGCRLDPLRAFIAAHYHEGKVEPAKEYEGRRHQACSYALEGVVRNAEQGYHEPVTTSFGDQFGVHLMKVEEVFKDKEKRRREGPLAPSEEVFAAWKKEKLLEKRKQVIFGVEDDEGEPMEGEKGPADMQVKGGGKKTKAKGGPIGRTNSEMPAGPSKPPKPPSRSLPPDFKRDANQPELIFAERPPLDERQLFEITSLGLFPTWSQTGTPQSELVRLLKHLLHQCCPEALKDGLLGVKQCFDAFEEEQRRQTASRAKGLAGSLQRADLMACEDADAMCTLLLEQAAEEAGRKGAVQTS